MNLTFTDAQECGDLISRMNDAAKKQGGNVLFTPFPVQVACPSPGTSTILPGTLVMVPGWAVAKWAISSAPGTPRVFAGFV